MGCERIDQCLAVCSCRAETKIGGVFVCEQMMTKLMRQVETSPTRIDRTVYKRNSDAVDSDIPAIYHARPKIQGERKKPQ